MQDNGIVQTTCTDKLVITDDRVYERSDFEEVTNPSDDTEAKDYNKVYQCREVSYSLAEYLAKTLITK